MAIVDYSSIVDLSTKLLDSYVITKITLEPILLCKKFVWLFINVTWKMRKRVRERLNYFFIYLLSVSWASGEFRIHNECAWNHNVLFNYVLFV